MALDMFLEIDGIEGESRDVRHRGALDVLAWSFGVSDADPAKPGGADVQGLALTVFQSTATVPLLLAVVSGRTIEAAVLTVLTAGERPVERYRMTLSDVVVTSLSQGASGGEDRAVENLTLAFGRLDVAYTPQGSDGRTGDPVTGAFTVKRGVALPG